MAFAKLTVTIPDSAGLSCKLFAMHFSVFVSMALAASAFAVPTELERRANEIPTAINMVTTSVKGLDTAVKGIRNSSDITALGNVATKATAVGDTLKKAQTMVMAAPQAGLLGSLPIQNAASDLTDSLNTLSTDLVAKQPVIKQAGLDQVVAQMLMMQKTQSGGFVKAISMKVPGFAQGLAQGQGDMANAALDKAIKAYSAGATPAAGNNTAAASPAAPAAVSSASAAAKRGLMENLWGA
jgi:hypothetical protein